MQNGGFEIGTRHRNNGETVRPEFRGPGEPVVVRAKTNVGACEDHELHAEKHNPPD